MGKKTTKRKTRWRALSIGEVPSDTEEDSQENTSTYRGEFPYQRPYNGKPHYHQHQRSNGGGGAAPHYGGGGTYNKYSNYSSQSTPTRNRNYHYQHNGEKYKSSRSNSTTSEPKITFNEDEYTRITTPRQDVLFKKGYLSKKKPSVAVAPTPNDGVTTSNGGVGGAPSGGSCGDSNPSTGYSSTTGGGTPEHHSQDGGEYRDGEFDQHQQFIFHNGFVDSNGIYFVNAGVPPGFEYGPMMLVGPAGQFIHPVEFYPPAPGMCFPPYAYRGKRYSTDSQAESASPNNETDSSNKTANTGNECSSSSIQSSTNGCDNGHASSSCADDQQQQSSQNDVAVEQDVDGVAPSNAVEHETTSEVGANHQGIPIGLGMGTVPPGAMFPPTQFIFPAPHPGFIPYPTNHHQMYMNGIQLQSSTSVNETVESKRYKKRRRRKVSRLQNENAADADYTDETTSSSDDNDAEPTSKHDPLPKTPSTDHSSRTTTMSSEPTNSNHVDPTRTDDTNPTSTETTPTNDPPNAHVVAPSCGVAAATDSSSFVKNETTDLSSDDLSSANHDEDEEEVRSNESDSRGPDVPARDEETANKKDNSRHRTDPNAEEVVNERRNCSSERLESGTDGATDLVLSEQCSRENEQPEREQTIEMSNGTLENHVGERESRKETESSDATPCGEENESTEPKPSLTTIYKVDAEEFVPMSMRVQQEEQLSSTNGTVDEELRAKFENYLNRNAENLEMQNAFELQIARTAANSVPETGVNTPIVPTAVGVDANHFDPEAVQEFVPRNGDFVEFVVPVSKSYPPKREHFGRHEHGVTKKYYNSNGAHYAHDHYSGYKRRNYNDRYYQKHNYQQQQQQHHRAYKEQNGYTATRNPRTNPDVVQNDARADRATSNGTECSSVSKEESDESPTTPTRTNVSSTYSQTTSENEPVACNGETCKEASIESADKKDSDTVESKGGRFRNQQEVSETTTTTTKKSISRTRETTAPMLNGNVSKEQTAEPMKKPHLPPGFSPKPQRAPHGHTRVQVVHATVAPSTDSAQSSPAKMKNYAQIVKKTQKAPPAEPPDRPISSNRASKQPDGESDVSGLSDFSPAKSVDDEWISVPSRKKGKSKQTGKIASGFEHIEETPRHVPRPEPVVPKQQEKQTKSVSVKSKIEKQSPVSSSTKETSRSSVKHVEKKIPEGSPEKVREVRETKAASKKHEAANVNGNEDPISKEAPSVKEAVKVERCEKQIDTKEKRAEKLPESVKKTEEKVEDVQIETPNRKSKKTKMKSKKSAKGDSRSPKTSTTQSSPLAFDIVGSIDKLGKRTDDETKTNVEMSLEIDKLIQRGLYANMEQTLRSFGGDTDAFLSIVDPSLDFMSPKALENGTISPSADAKQNLLDQHVMRTLSECQRMFAYKTMKEVDVKSPTRDVEATTTTTISKNENRKGDPKASTVASKTHSDETKSSKKSKKGKQKHRSPNREACVETNSAAVIETTEKHVEQAATTSTETVCHKKENLDMDTVNAILRDLSAERKRELLLDGSVDEESDVCAESGLSLTVESDAIGCGFQTALPESRRTTEREDVETVIVPDSCRLTEEEEGEDDGGGEREGGTGERGEQRSESVERTSAVLSGPWTEDEKSACRELQSDSVEQISDLCESSEVSSPDQKGCIYYSVEDLNDVSPGSNVEVRNDAARACDRSSDVDASAVITQEPHVDRSKPPVLEDDCSVVSSPDDPRSTSSEEQNMSITEAVRHWLHETKEKSPDVEVLKSPEKLKLEGAGRARRFLSSDTDDSDDDGDDEGGDDGTEARERVARRTGPKNVKGNPLFAASVDTEREPTGIDDADDEEDERGAGSIDADDGFDDRRVALSSSVRTEPENRDDGIDARGDDVRCSPSVEAGLEVGESFETFAAPRIEYKIAANVVNIAREIANTVNPVVNGIGLGRDGAVPNGYEITESGIKVRESIVRVINGATVRDVAVIRRAVSESGSRPFDGLDDGDALDGRDGHVKKSRSCIEMTDFSAPMTPIGRATSAETQLNGDVGASPVADLLDCWENDLNVGSYRATTTTSPLIIATDMNVPLTNLDNDVERRNNNNNVAAVAVDDNDDVDAYDCNLNSFDDTKRAKEKLSVDENAEDVLEAYESVYGTNLDYLEIKRKVYETAQRQIPPNQNLLFPPGGDRPVPCGAICCSVM